MTHGMDGWKDGMGWSQASQGAWGLASSWADARANRSGLAEVVGSRRRRENSRKPIANRRREAGSGLPSCVWLGGKHGAERGRGGSLLTVRYH